MKSNEENTMRIAFDFRTAPLIFSIFIMSLFTIFPLNAQDLPGPIVYSVPGMDAADVHPDIIYKRDGLDEIKMDIYNPPDLSSDVRLPAVIFVHGGPLGNNPSPGAKDWPFYQSYGKLMAASGFVGITFDHRYTGIDQKALDTSFSDVEAAIHFVRAKSASYHIDPDRIALWVFSGGGPHLSIVLKNQMTFIRCMVSYYGLHDLSSQAASAGETPQAMRKYSPVTYLSKEYKYRPPLLIVRAGFDFIPDINRDIEIFFTKMLSLNSDVSLLNHPFGLHGFDSQNDDEQSRYIIKATVEFLKSRLNRPALFKANEAYTASEFYSLLLGNKTDAAIEFFLSAQKENGNKKIVDELLSEDKLGTLSRHLFQSDPASAFKFYEFVCENKPYSPTSHLLIAISNENRGNIDQAVAIAKKAIELTEKTTEFTDSQKKAYLDAAAALIKRHE